MNAKTLKQVLVVLFYVFTISVLDAQTPKWKDLQTESDGFQWYQYTYEKNSNGNWSYAAFDLNGKRLTCNCECFIYYREEGFLEAKVRKDANDNYVTAIYDKYGNCVIPDSFGFTSISIYTKPEYQIELILCSGSMNTPGEYCFTMDGRYYVDADLVWWTTPGEFSKAKKKPVSTLGGGAYASSSTTGGSSSSSSGGKSGSSSSSGGKSGGSKLLYQGDYNEGVHVTNGVSFPNDVPYRIIGAEVSIYEDKIDFYGNVIEFKKNQNGNRVYQDYNNKVVVDPDYNFTYYYILPGWDGDDIVTSARFTRIDSYSPQGGYYGGGGTGTYTGGNTGNDGNKGNTTTTQTKQHKCGVCGGTGREIRTDAVSFGKTKYCGECGKTVPDYHYHAPCRSCGGKGWW